MKVESVWEVCCDTIAGLRHEGAIMISWLKRRLVGWLEGCQQHEIERLHEEGCRLKEEVLRLTGQDRIVLSSEERRLLAAAARWRYGEPFRAGRILAQVEAENGAASADYRFGFDRPRWRVAARGAAQAELPRADSFEHWVKERVRGCRTDGSGRLRTFDVAHPAWMVRPVTGTNIDVEFARMYGPSWAVLDATPPASVIYAVGSDVAVSAPA